MILLSHPTGNQFVRHTALALAAEGLLAEFWTALNWNSQSPLNRLLPARLRGEFNRRAFPAEIRPLTHSHPARELSRLASQMFGLRSLTRHETGMFSVDAVYRALDRRVARRLRKVYGFQGVYAYEDAALATFQTAHRAGLKCFYDLPIAYWETSQRLLKEEAQRWPAWEPTLVGTRDSPAKLERKRAEAELADVIVCCSQFVADSVPEALRKSKRVIVAEFGTPAIGTPEREPDASRQGQPLRVLFAGSMSQRKGLADLFQAMKLLNRSDVELVVMGSPIVPLEFYHRQLPGFRHETTRPHDEVLNLMRSCDVLALPSIVEGRALVQQEAMACGLPLIVTANAGGADLIEEGRTGFLVPIRAPDKIAEKIAWFADHRSELPAMRQAARAKAEACSWNRYGGRIVAVVRETLAQRK